MTSMTPAEIVHRYFAAWNEADTGRRGQRIAHAFAPDAVYRDPLATAEGHAGLAALIAGVQAQFPGHVFTQRGAIDAHAGGLRFSWSLGLPEQRAVAAGTDVATLAADGRLARITGFLDGVIKTPYVTTRDGEQLFVRETGRGAPIVLCASAGMSGAMWQYQTAALPDRRCLAYDRRAAGRSTPAATGFDLDTLAEDLAAVLEAREVHGATLVGHSLGCAEAIHYLARHGSSRVARLVLVAPAAPYLGRTAADTAALHASWRADFPAWLDASKAAFVTPETSPAMLAWLVDDLLRNPLHAQLALDETLATLDLRSELARVDVPTLVLQGDRDASAPLALAQACAAGIPDARLELIAGGPHGVFVTHAARVTAAIAG